MKLKYINIDNWKRKEYFYYYYKNVKCTFTMNTELDITELIENLKDKNIKLYPVLIYLLSRIVNKYTEFRMCMDKNGKLGYWENMKPAYTVFNKKKETFFNLWSDYDENFSKFYNNYLKDEKLYENSESMFLKGEMPPYTFSISIIPWVNFTGFNLNIYSDGSYLLPIFTFGKYMKKNDKIIIPLSIQVHHAVCDGFHAGRFFNELQEICLDRDWLEI